MNFISWDILQRMARRSIRQICDPVIAMKSVDQRRQAGGLAGEAREHDSAPAPIQQRGELLAGVAGRTGALEDHLVAARLETFYPARERRRAVEECGLLEQPRERDRHAEAPGRI